MSKLLEELLDELETFAKAMPDGEEEKDEKDPDNDGDIDDDGDGDIDDDGDGDTDNDSSEMAKSMTVTLENGETAEAIDGHALIKSFQDRLDANIEGFGKVIRAQTALIKSLQADITALKKQGAGRKSVVVDMHGGQPLEKSNAPAPGDVLTKCLEAQKAGRLTALDVSVAESCVNRGMQIPHRILAAAG